MLLKLTLREMAFVPSGSGGAGESLWRVCELELAGEAVVDPGDPGGKEHHV